MAYFLATVHLKYIQHPTYCDSPLALPGLFCDSITVLQVYCIHSAMTYLHELKLHVTIGPMYYVALFNKQQRTTEMHLPEEPNTFLQ